MAPKKADAETLCEPLASPWGRLIAAGEQALREGELREARRELARHLASRHSTPPPRVTFLARTLLARSAARIGLTDEATGWLRAARRGARTDPPTGVDLEWQLASLELDWAREDRHRLARSARHLIERAAASLPLDRLADALYTAASALAALDDRTQAERCVTALVRLGSSDSASIDWRVLAVRAELSYRAALDAWVDAQLGTERAEQQAGLPASAAECAVRARDDFHAARVAAQGEGRVIREQLQCGCDKASLLSIDDPAALARLEHHHAWARQIPLCREIAESRAALAIAHLSQQRFARAARWFQALFECDQSASGAQLYLASLAHEQCGDRHAALFQLRRYCAERAPATRITHTPPASTALAKTRRVAGRSAEALVGAALELAGGRLGTPTSVTRLACSLGVSRRTLEYAFREARATSPKKALTALRLQEAQRQIERGEIARRPGLETVARRSGFPSYQAFARAVRGAYAMAPSGLLADRRK